MKTICNLFLGVLLCFSFAIPETFFQSQLKYQRVRQAQNEKGELIDARLKTLGIKTKDLVILIVVYKEEGTLQLYAKNKAAKAYSLLTTYTVCAKSGVLGPKQKMGDSQVPEGFYYVNRFNPSSNFYLSLGLNYPNKSDLVRAKGENPGGDIFIHGDCVTIGCLPMTNDKMKEIYLYATHARNNGQIKIPVYIFPFQMSKANSTHFYKTFAEKPATLAFWETLKPGYNWFMNHKIEINYKYSSSGNYAY